MQRTKNLTRNHGQSESTPFSTGNANAPLSTSNASTPPSTSNTTTPEKTRAPVSVRAREVKENQLPKNTTRIPASVREREQKLRKGLLSDSYADDGSEKLIGKSGLLTDSFEDGGEIINALSNLDSSSDEVSDKKTYSEPKLSIRKNHSHTVKTAVSSPAKTAVDPAMPSGITMLVGTIFKAIEKQDWGRLDSLINGMREQKLRLDDTALKDLPAAQKIIQWAPLTLLTSNDHADHADHDAQWLLALDLLDLGCDWNAKDSQGNRVIDLLRKQADPSLIEFVVEGFPHLKHLFSKT
jgi:ABC-type uncharacterized transport system involved in gliding motility auxiliary subunit